MFVAVDVHVAVGVDVKVDVGVGVLDGINVTGWGLLSVRVAEKGVIVAGKVVRVAVMVGTASGKDTLKAAPTMIKLTALAASRTVPTIRPGVIRQQIFLDFGMGSTPQVLATPQEDKTYKPAVWHDRFPSLPGRVVA